MPSSYFASTVFGPFERPLKPVPSLVRSFSGSDRHITIASANHSGGKRTGLPSPLEFGCASPGED